MKARLDHLESLTPDIKTLWFKPERPINYISGQFIEMILIHPNPDDRGTRRWFTLSSSPTDAPLVSITTKFSDKSSTFKVALSNLKPGDSLNISEPMGDFVLPKDPTIPLVFVAGGIGITPYHSIIRWLLKTEQERSITFLYAASNEHELVFQKEFEHYGMKRIIVIGHPVGSWDGETGQLDAKRIVDLTKPSSESLIYISGPEPMVEALSNQLKDLGTSSSRVVGDFFPGYKGI